MCQVYFQSETKAAQGNHKQIVSSLKHSDWRPHDSAHRVNAIQARCGHHSPCLSRWSSSLLCQKSKWKAAKFKFRYLGPRRPSQHPLLHSCDLSASANPTQLSQVQTELTRILSPMLSWIFAKYFRKNISASLSSQYIVHIHCLDEVSIHSSRRSSRGEIDLRRTNSHHGFETGPGGK